MKLLTCILSLALVGCSTLTPIRHTKAYKLATRSDLPGRDEPMKCAPFALSLFVLLAAEDNKRQAKGLPSYRAYLICYEWTSVQGTDKHAVVGYWDQGTWWVMDNMMGEPHRIDHDIKDTTSLAMAAQEHHFRTSGHVRVFYVQRLEDDKIETFGSLD